MAGLCGGGNKPPGSLKASKLQVYYEIIINWEAKLFSLHWRYATGTQYVESNAPAQFAFKPVGIIVAVFALWPLAVCTCALTSLLVLDVQYMERGIMGLNCPSPLTLDAILAATEP
ncbi:hypothetical protein ANN_02072 [Periplaneta americana]|uniref:Uncharacterized protein n=1 Tax=Periplaneta americana TaxID=6978 RepID=A0ABQ8TVC8_PERAM|nr:hypothetical protein ANN_02072 [Periplaneta americana]